MSIEWDSLILGDNELNTVGPTTKNARRAIEYVARMFRRTVLRALYTPLIGGGWVSPLPPPRQKRFDTVQHRPHCGGC